MTLTLRLSFRLPAAIAAALLAALPAAAQMDPPPGPAPAGAAIDITYIANEGFLIGGAGRMVLIDAIFTEGFGRFATPSPEILEQERKALPPFDRLDAVLITHFHPDHFSAADVVQHLANDRAAVLLGPRQVTDLLKGVDGYPAIAGQIVAVAPETGGTVESVVRGLKIRSTALRHLSDTQEKHQNLGYLLDLGGFKLLHVGDAGANTPADYQGLARAGGGIDLALLNCYWFDEENVAAARDVIQAINPKAIILMHVGVDQADHYRDLLGKIEGLPPVYLAESPGEAWRFQRAGDALVCSRAALRHPATSPTSP